MLQSRYSQIRSNTDNATSSFLLNLVIVPVAILRSFLKSTGDIPFSIRRTHIFLYETEYLFIFSFYRERERVKHLLRKSANFLLIFLKFLRFSGNQKNPCHSPLLAFTWIYLVIDMLCEPYEH